MTTKSAVATAPAKDVPISERPISRLIAESSVYDFKPTARALLMQIAMMRMAEESKYPADAPDDFKADKDGWCWLSQFKLGLRVGISESQVNRLIQQFKEDGAIFYRDWHDKNGTHHAEYKINEKVFQAHQRPSQDRDVVRPTRYSKPRPKKGWFSAENQPKKKLTAVEEMDEE
jgi:hypothetical protein